MLSLLPNNVVVSTLTGWQQSPTDRCALLLTAHVLSVIDISADDQIRSFAITDIDCHLQTSDDVTDRLVVVLSRKRQSSVVVSETVLCSVFCL